MHIRDLIAAGAPEPLVEEWAKTIAELTPVQESAVQAGALTGGSNLLVVAPTTSGKTFVGEMAAASAAYRTRRHALFLVPFRALADEHFELFRDRYGDLLSTVISTSDWGQFDADIRAGNFGLAVLTYEKLTGLLISRPQLLAEASVLVVDELQMLRDAGRGPGLELMLTQVMRAEKRPQLVALSASLDELNNVHQWLSAELVVANERPVPLDEGVIAADQGEALIRRDGSLRRVQVADGTLDKDDAIASVCRGLVKEGKQVLVFRTSAARALPTAQAIARQLPAAGLSTDTLALLDDLESSDTLEEQRRVLASRVGFHTADLPTGERRAVERSFRNGDTRVVVSSGTLAMGVNLPTDAVLVADTVRFIPNRWEWSREALSVADYKNQVGRAGRLGQRERGLGLLLVEHAHQRRQLFDFYCDGAVEPIESRLPEAEFDDVVFRIVAAGLASTEDELVEFIASTFAYLTFWQHYGGITDVQQGASRAITACLESGLVRKQDGKLRVTRSGQIFAAHGIPLGVATQLSELVDALADTDLPTEEIVHRIAACDALFERRPFTKWEKTTRRLRDPREGLAIDRTAVTSDHQLHAALQTAPHEDRQARVLLRTGCLIEWIDGAPEQALGRRFDGCTHARLRAMGQTAAWLTDAVTRVAAVRKVEADRVGELRRLALRLRYGLPPELAPLASVNAAGVTRAALVRLFEGDDGRQLYDPDNLLELGPGDFDGLLTPREAQALQEAIVQDRGESLRRRRRSHRERAGRASFNSRIIDDLYTARGGGLEQAVTDALRAVGLSATRVVRQPHAEEDIQVDHPDGTVVVSVTASDSDTKSIRWTKAREILGTGAGMNPINYVCVGRPSFHSLAERSAKDIAREEGARRILLIPIYVLADAVLRCQEERLEPQRLADILATHGGVLEFDDLDDAAQPDIGALPG